MLEKLLVGIQSQIADNRFSYSLVIVDNDRSESAKKTVDAFAGCSSIPVEYHVVSEQNIALARNKAIERATGSYIAFIDDDEVPRQDWLLQLYSTCAAYDVTGVLGPVKPQFEVPPARWIVKGKFFEKGFHRTGTVLTWTETRTSNALIRNSFNSANKSPFNPALGRGGEDRDLFKRLIERGHVFVSCREAVVYETIPEERCKRIFFLKRALLRGKVAAKFSSLGSLDTIKSILAIFTYTAILPFAFFAGHHRFMKYLIKNFDHLGKLLGLLNFNVIKDNYVMCTDALPTYENRRSKE
jgi:succinoglycan biosynthesis protein ExoM